MDSIISQLITEWGTLGLLLGLIIWIVIDSWKVSKNRKDNNDRAMNAISGLDNKLDNKIETLSKEIKIVDQKVDNVIDNFNDKIDFVQDQIDKLPEAHIDAIKEISKIKQGEHDHSKMFDDLVKLGPNLHQIMKSGIEDTNADHMFIGSFHNGNKSLTGIPYYKFDIIAERFKPNKVERDCEFAYMYKDADILRFDMLPTMLLQQGMLHFNVSAEGDTELSDIDDIIWRRMRGRGIRQIALRLLKDSKDTPSGFVGIVKYDFEELNLNELDICGSKLEMEYHKAEKNKK